MIGRYKHIFFDLDHTLWDYNANSSATLLEIIDVFSLRSLVRDQEKWINDFSVFNDEVWNQYEKGILKKAELRQERFRLLMETIGIGDEELVGRVSEFYLESGPLKKSLMPGVRECLTYLNGKYELHIISNGFSEVQLVKLQTCEIAHFFKSITTSEKVLAAKPDRRIFQEALKPNNASKKNSLYIGDNFEKDIVGAARFGIDQVWYNPTGIIVHSDVKATFEIGDLIELKSLL